MEGLLRHISLSWFQYAICMLEHGHVYVHGHMNVDTFIRACGYTVMCIWLQCHIHVVTLPVHKDARVKSDIVQIQ
jgi:hypothetical protein